MVIPVCFKCQSRLEVVSQPEAGIELMKYQCTLCHHSSAGFLLGYVEPAWRDSGASPPAEAADRRARFFMGIDKQYKLRAKIQTILDVTARETRGRKRAIPENKP